MSTLCHSAKSTKAYASSVDAIPIVTYHPSISQRRNPSTGSVESLKSLLRTHSNLNPGEQPGPDHLAWTHEEMLTWCFQALESVSTRDLGEKSEQLWVLAQAYLSTLIDLNPPGSYLHDSALTIMENVYQQFSSEIRTADRDLYASNALKAIGIDVPVFFVDGDPSFFCVDDLLYALQTRLMEAGFPFEIFQENMEWIHIEDSSVPDEEPGIIQSSSDADEEALLSLGELFG